MAPAHAPAGHRRLWIVSVELGWGLAIALGLLVALAVGASLVGGLHVEKDVLIASARAVAQLAVVSLVIAAAVTQLWSAWLFVLLMFGVATYTSWKRVAAAPTALPYVGAAIAAGTVPVLLVIFLTGAVPWIGVSVISVAGIVVGNMMTAHTLTGRRLFGELSHSVGLYEAGLALGLMRPDAMDLITRPVVAEAMVPALDQTRTVGLVTLPGAFVGVLLGGGSPLQAGAAQVLVLVGILAGQAVTVTVAERLIRHGRILTPALALVLHP